jgi:hypothetical protein
MEMRGAKRLAPFLVIARHVVKKQAMHNAVQALYPRPAIAAPIFWPLSSFRNSS